MIIRPISRPCARRSSAWPDWKPSRRRPRAPTGCTISHLDAPDEGRRRHQIVLLNEKDEVIASMIAGKTQGYRRARRRHGPVRAQTGFGPELARAQRVRAQRRSQGLDEQGCDRASTAPESRRPMSRRRAGPSYVVRRDKPSDADFSSCRCRRAANSPIRARRMAWPRRWSASPSIRWRRPAISTSPMAANS